MSTEHLCNLHDTISCKTCSRYPPKSRKRAVEQYMMAESLKDSSPHLEHIFPRLLLSILKRSDDRHKHSELLSEMMLVELEDIMYLHDELH